MDNQFQVLSFEKKYRTSAPEEDIIPCEKWLLMKADISTIMEYMQPIRGEEWHHLFGHYPCSLEGQVGQNGFVYHLSINGGGWLAVQGSDTVLYFGIFEEEMRKYFIDIAWNEDDF